MMVGCICLYCISMANYASTPVISDAVWEETRESTSLDILETYAVMRSALNMPVFGTLGNQ